MKVHEAIEELKRLDPNLDLVDQNRTPIIKIISWNFSDVYRSVPILGNKAVVFTQDPWSKR